MPDEPPHQREENDQKRRIRDIDAFEAKGHVWEDMRFVNCDCLRGLPDGPPIPEDAGEPPQPSYIGKDLQGRLVNSTEARLLPDS